MHPGHKCNKYYPTYHPEMASRCGRDKTKKNDLKNQVFEFPFDKEDLAYEGTHSVCK